MRRYLIAYDISDSRARAAVMRRMEKAGRRIQKSVFIVEMRPHALESLERELHTFLGEEDSLLVLPICETCLQLARWHGNLPPLAILA